MMFDLSAFGQVCIWVLPIVIFLSIFVAAFLNALMQQPTYGKTIVVIFFYIFCIGVIVHEGAHQLMSGVFGVEVRDVRYFKVESKEWQGKVRTSVGGRVTCGDIRSITAALFLGIAPLLVNGLLVALIYYLYPLWMETGYQTLLIYLGIALAVGARPSKQDLTVCLSVFRRYPGRAFIELLILCIFGLVMYCLALFQVNGWIIFGAFMGFIIVCIIDGRMKIQTAQKHYSPR